MQRHAVIVAGGAGQRMGRSVPKQFLELGGKPILMHTLEQFYMFDSSIDMVLVLPQDYVSYWKTLIRQYHFTIPHRIVDGGKHRFFSVQNGLKELEPTGVVAVHDAVRPILTPEFLKTVFEEAEKHGTAIPYVDVKNTLRKIEKDTSKWVNRNEYKQIQTPQVFDTKKLKEAYLLKYEDAFTDDATLFDKLDWPLHLVYGNDYNIKITTPEDLLIAEVFLKYLKEKQD